MRNVTALTFPGGAWVRGSWRKLKTMSERAQNEWKTWLKILAPVLLAPIFAALATVGVLDWRLATLEGGLEKLENTLASVKADLGALNTQTARYDERIRTLQNNLDGLRAETRDEQGALRERVHNAETNIRVLQREHR